MQQLVSLCMVFGDGIANGSVSLYLLMRRACDLDLDLWVLLIFIGVVMTYEFGVA